MRILLADDHDIMRRGLKALLEGQPGWQVCAEARTGREAIALAEKHLPHVVVMDLTMPELNGLDATRHIRRALPKTEVLIFTMHETEELVRDVFAAGARGYVLKSDAARHLVAAVESLAQHRPYFSSQISQNVLAGFLKGEGVHPPEDAANPASRLTAREREVVQLLAEGQSNKEVADRLGISVKTVETHRAAIMRKLELPSLADLVRYAIRNKIIEP